MEVHLLGRGGANFGCRMGVIAVEVVVVVAIRRALGKLGRCFRKIDFQQLKCRSVGIDEGILSVESSSAGWL